MQGSLVRDLAGQLSIASGRMAEGHTFEPFAPGRIQMTLDRNLISMGGGLPGKDRRRGRCGASHLIQPGFDQHFALGVLGSVIGVG